MVEIKRITLNDDLSMIAASIKGSQWGKDNEMDDYDELALRKFLASPDRVLLIVYVDKTPVGTLIGTKIFNPYKNNKNWLYIDEIDVHPDYRRQGIGGKMLEKALEIGGQMGLKEAWLGTESDNTGANHLYKSFDPSEIEDFIGYTYKLKLDEKKHD